jgi:hypothetical protein
MTLVLLMKGMIEIRKLLSTTDTNDTGSTDERYDAQLCQSQRALQSR